MDQMGFLEAAMAVIEQGVETRQEETRKRLREHLQGVPWTAEPEGERDDWTDEAVDELRAGRSEFYLDDPAVAPEEDGDV